MYKAQGNTLPLQQFKGMEQIEAKSLRNNQIPHYTIYCKEILSLYCARRFGLIWEISRIALAEWKEKACRKTYKKNLKQ